MTSVHRHPAVIAVGQLIATETMRIEITPTVAYTVRAPCLLQQLVDAIGVGLETGGRGVPGSRPPIAVEAWDLWVEVTHNAHAWAGLLGVDARRYVTPEPAGARPVNVRGTPPAGRLLRAVALQAVTTGRDLVADAITRCAERWARQITAMLTGAVEQRAIRGAGCPTCTEIRPYPRGLIGPWAGPQHTTTIIEEREENGRLVPYRVPAIVLVVREQGQDRLRWLVCRACGWSDALTVNDTPSSQLDDIESQAA